MVTAMTDAINATLSLYIFFAKMKVANPVKNVIKGGKNLITVSPKPNNKKPAIVKIHKGFPL